MFYYFSKFIKDIHKFLLFINFGANAELRGGEVRAAPLK